MKTLRLDMGLCMVCLPTSLHQVTRTGIASNPINAQALNTVIDVRFNINDDKNVFTASVDFDGPGNGQGHFPLVEQKLLQKLELETHN